jgi:hypothetical protein
VTLLGLWRGRPLLHGRAGRWLDHGMLLVHGLVHRRGRLHPGLAGLQSRLRMHPRGRLGTGYGRLALLEHAADRARRVRLPGVGLEGTGVAVDGRLCRALVVGDDRRRVYLGRRRM